MISFKSLQLIVDNRIPEYNDFLRMGSSNDTYEFENILYAFNYELNEEYFWLSGQYNNMNQYNPEVIRYPKIRREVNPKIKEQIELNNQFFFLYLFQKDILYLSNILKKKIITNYLKDNLTKDIYIKNIYSSYNEFEKIVKTIKELSFIARRNLFKTEDGIFDSCNNIFGLGCDKLFIKADYDNTPISELKMIMKKLVNKSELDDLLIVGYDDSGIEAAFNICSVIKSVDLEPPKNANGMYDENIVKQLILDKVR